MATEKDAPKEATDTYMVKTPVKMGGVVHQDGDTLELTAKQAESLAGYGAIYTADDDDDHEEVEEFNPDTGKTEVVRKKKSAAKRARR
jgi:hypothetical protein